MAKWVWEFPADSDAWPCPEACAAMSEPRGIYVSPRQADAMLRAALAVLGSGETAGTWTEYGVRTTAGYMHMGGQRADDRNPFGPYANPAEIRRKNLDTCRYRSDWQPVQRMVGPWSPVGEETRDDD